MAISLGGARAPARSGGRGAGRPRARAAARPGAAVDTAVLGLTVVAAVVLLALPAELRDRAAAALRRTAVAPLVELQRLAEVQRAKYLSYDERVAQRATLARDAADVAGLRAENDRMRRMLGLGARLQWGFVNAEAIPTQTAGELARQPILLTFMLTQGGRAGVTPFAPVVAPEGLVGMVSQVDPATSIAITYANADFRVSAQTPDGSAYGIVQPHLGTGAERALLEIRGVAFRSPLKAGQLIVSSGQGGTYPAGIPVGTVVRELQTVERWARTYLLEPSARLADVGAVMVLRKPRVLAGLDSVWTSITASDSAARRVAAAGDSIARDALLREAAARRAAMEAAAADSARRGAVAPDSSGAGGGAPSVPPASPAPGPGATPAAAPTSPVPGAPPPGEGGGAGGAGGTGAAGGGAAAGVATGSAAGVLAAPRRPVARPSVPRPGTPGAGASVTGTRAADRPADAAGARGAERPAERPAERAPDRPPERPPAPTPTPAGAAGGASPPRPTVPRPTVPLLAPRAVPPAGAASAAGTTGAVARDTAAARAARAAARRAARAAAARDSAARAAARQSP